MERPDNLEVFLPSYQRNRVNPYSMVRIPNVRKGAAYSRLRAAYHKNKRPLHSRIKAIPLKKDKPTITEQKSTKKIDRDIQKNRSALTISNKKNNNIYTYTLPYKLYSLKSNDASAANDLLLPPFVIKRKVNP